VHNDVDVIARFATDGRLSSSIIARLRRRIVAHSVDDDAIRRLQSATASSSSRPSPRSSLDRSIEK
jgi:hypothetical protein